MKCPTCARENREGAAFCDSCGAPLAVACPTCSAQLRPGAKFCDSCGTPQSIDTRSQASPQLAQKILSERGRIEGERRTVTILFADAKGFTPMSERMDAEQVYTFMQTCYGRMVEAVHRHEGTISQFTGDGIMAIFGAPIAHEDSARRAVAAALEMQRALRVFVDDAGIETAFRVGLNTGPVVAGTITDDLTMDYTAIGDTSNLAARMEQICEPGAVYMTDNTYREVADYFDVEDLGLLEVKGKADKVHVYKAVAERAIRTRLDASVARGLSPFLGRDRELQALQAFWQEALAGRGQIVLIAGPPGIGKSRLLLEFRRSLGPDVIWREAHCVSYGDNIPYLPVVELVKSGFGITDADDDGAIISRVDEDTAQWSPEAQKTAPYLKFLLQVDPGDEAVAHMDPMERRAGILDALRALVLERARIAPRVVVVEDLHWADAQSEEAFRACADVIAASPVLMILTFRPGYLHPSADLPHANRVVLGDLDETARAQLATATLSASALPANLAGPITAKAEGNPLFIEEVAKALASGVADADAVPNSLQDVILARIDRLERGAREALQLASVIGREFTLRLLNRISDVHAQLDGVLAELKTLELIYEKAFFPELAYMFKHALTHDVAYSTLLMERRRGLHRVVAAAIEELYADRIAEQYETLAHHYVRAEEWDKALDYLMKAIEKAVAAFATPEAIEFCGQAIEVLAHLGRSDSEQAARLYEQRGLLHASVGHLEDARADFDRMGAIGSAVGDRRLQAWALSHRGGWVEYFGHDFETSESTLMQAMDLCRQGDEDIVYSVHAWRASNFAVIGRLSEFWALQPELERLEEYATPTHKGFITLFDGAFPNWEGRFQDAIDSFESRRPFTDVAKPITIFLEWFQGVAMTGAGQYEQALDQLERVVKDAERVGDVFGGLRVINTIGWLYSEIEDVDRGIEWNRRCLERAEGLTFPDPEIESNAKLNLADLAIKQGKLDEAEEHLKWVERPVRHPNPEDQFALWLYSQHFCHTYGELELARGDLDRAQSFGEECLARGSETGRKKNIVKAHRLLGQVALARGDLDSAEAHLVDGLHVAREIGNPPQLWKTLAALADLRAAQGRDDDAAEATRETTDVINTIAAGLHADRRSVFLSSPAIRAILERVPA